MWSKFRPAVITKMFLQFEGRFGEYLTATAVSYPFFVILDGCGAGSEVQLVTHVLKCLCVIDSVPGG